MVDLNSDITAFRNDYPLMALRPSPGREIVLKGQFDFSARDASHPEIKDTFALTIKVPLLFPKRIPVVTETDGKIPRTGEFHVNRDGSLCLGAPIRLLHILSAKPSLVGFAELCLVPYLYAVSLKQHHGIDFVFGQLDHEGPGMLKDYTELLGLTNPSQARAALVLLGKRKRLANKRPCPCECGVRLGKCRFNVRLARIRRLSCRSWFREQLHYLR